MNPQALSEHLHATAAFRRDLPEAERLRAEELWRIGADLRGSMSTLSAAGALAVSGRTSPRAYRSTIAEVLSRLNELAGRLADVGLAGPLEHSLDLALADLRRAVRSEHSRGPSPKLNAPALNSYLALRELGRVLWALELRPEGLPLRAEARDRYDESFRSVPRA